MKTGTITKTILALAALFVAQPALADDIKVSFSQSGFYDPNTGIANNGILSGSLVLRDDVLSGYYDTLIAANVTYTDNSGTQMFNSITNGSGNYDAGGYFFGFSLQNGQDTISSINKGGFSAGDLSTLSGTFVSHSDDNLNFVAAPTPEPASWAMLILGLALIGGLMRNALPITVLQRGPAPCPPEAKLA